MTKTLLTLLLLSPSLLCAQSDLDRTKDLMAKRTSITSEFAKAQEQLRSKNSADNSAGEATLSQLGPRIETLRDELVRANQTIIQAFNQEPLFHGAYDPSATIIASLSKLMTENRELPRLALVTTPPFNPQDINKFQVTLDRIKKGIDEHSHAAKNYASTFVQRNRKPVPATKKPATLPL